MMIAPLSTITVNCSCGVAGAVVGGYFVAIDTIGVVCVIGEWLCD